ncbi:MAG: hypothetical protein ACLU4J_27900 [Butyricimonas paravirosa]
MEKAELKIDYTVYRESYPEGYEDLCRAALDVTKMRIACIPVLPWGRRADE